MAAPIGLIANPASGKDVRRLVAHASTFDNAEKANIIRRVLLGALAAGAERFLYMPDDHGLVPGALTSLPAVPSCEPVAIPFAAAALDSERAAAAMREAGCAVVVTLGGDGTNRTVARGWRDAPLIAISTGTNNVFPDMLEGTVAGAAAGLIAAGAVALEQVARPAKRIALQIEGEEDDLALIDAALLDGAFTGSRALWDLSGLRSALLARAEPAATGISAIGGLIEPLAACEDAALWLEAGAAAGGLRVRAPVAPGRYEEIAVRSVRRLGLGEAVELRGSGLIALDGERERRLRTGQAARLCVLRDGPRVVDVGRTLTLAARNGAFRVGGAPVAHAG